MYDGTAIKQSGSVVDTVRGPFVSISLGCSSLINGHLMNDASPFYVNTCLFVSLSLSPSLPMCMRERSGCLNIQKKEQHLKKTKKRKTMGKKGERKKNVYPAEASLFTIGGGP